MPHLPQGADADNNHVELYLVALPSIFVGRNMERKFGRLSYGLPGTTSREAHEPDIAHLTVHVGVSLP